MLNECGNRKKVSDISMHSQRGRWERGESFSRSRILFEAKNVRSVA